MDTSKMDIYIRVNFPLTMKEFTVGDGEGMWMLVDPETKEALDAGTFGGRYSGILDNDSVYFPGLNHGEVIPFEMRGKHRPVADFPGFLSKLPRLTQKERTAIHEEIILRQMVEQTVDSILEKIRKTGGEEDHRALEDC